ncbi:MAG: ankyrin repeat domain-containing protein [Prosthecobacter sp.]|jgi:hypothetical protein
MKHTSHLLTAVFLLCVRIAGAHEDDPEVTYEHQELREAASAAVRNGNTTLFDSLLKAGLQLSKPLDPEYGDTALHEAVSARKPTMIRHLLSLGADPLAMDFYGDKPVDELKRCEDKKELTECLAALKREPTDYDLKKLNDIPVPVWREVLGVPAKTPDPLAPPVKDAPLLVTFISINDLDPAPEMKPVLDAHYPGWRPGSLIEPAEPPANARHGSIIRDKKSKEFGEHVQITLIKTSSTSVRQEDKSLLAKLARDWISPAYEFKVRTTRGGAMNGGGWAGYIVFIEGYWIKLGTYGWDE